MSEIPPSFAMKASFVLVSVLATCALAGCLSPQEHARKEMANQNLKQCLDSPTIYDCQTTISAFKYLSSADLKLATEKLREAKEEERLRLEKVRYGETVVSSIAKKVNYYQDNCQQRVISRNVFGAERIWENCIGGNLLSGLFGQWGKDSLGRWVTTMFLSNEIWEGIGEKEREALKEWLKEHGVRRLSVGRVTPSRRFSGNTITVDRIVWENL